MTAAVRRVVHPYQPAGIPDLGAELGCSMEAGGATMVAMAGERL